MTTYFKKIAVVAIWLLASTVAFGATVQKMRVMTFNIPYGNIKVTDGNGQNTWTNRAKAIHNYVDSISPDLLGIQEGVKDEMISLLSGMPGYAMIGCARNDGAENGEYTPILYKTSRFYVEESGNYWFTDTPDKPSKTPGAICYRVATWALFTDKVTGARFIYTNTHLDHGKDSVRVIQAKIAKEKMVELSEKYGKNLRQILTADFNMNRSSIVYPYLIDYKLKTKDVWVEARRKSQKGKDGFSSTPDNEIDFIFVYGTGVSCSYAELGNRWTPDGFIMSDHNPMFADISWITSTEDMAREAVADAYAAADSTRVLTANRTRLITSTSQLSSDGLEDNSGMQSIIDRNTNTYARSGTSVPNQPHYIQVKLDSPITEFNLQYNRSADTNGLVDRWEDVLVKASQDGQHWDYVTELYKFANIENRSYTANVQMHRPYSYVRFHVMRTSGMRLANGAPRFSLSELQMSDCRLNTSCDYAKYTAVAEAADAVYAAVQHTQELIDEGKVTKADVTALTEKTKALRQLRADLANAIDGVTSDATTGQAQVYTLGGVRLSAPQRGVNIIDGKMVMMK